MKLLADTSALLALTMRDDQNHGRATAFLRECPEARFVLTELILAELVTRARARGGAAAAVGIARKLLASRRYQVVFSDPGLVCAALEWMDRFADKRLSLTDCSSFELMARLGLSGAFTFDRDFRDCGFEMLP
jgi:predicted nucleic acid-binding protein